MAWWRVIKHPGREVVADHIRGRSQADVFSAQKTSSRSASERAAGVRFEVVAGQSPYGVRGRRIAGRRSLRSR